MGAKQQMQQTQAHLKAMLWAAESARVYAVIDGAVVPQLQDRLSKADVRGWSCLLRGALPPEQAGTAPCVVELSPEAEFTTWLLGKATEAYPGWGVLGVGPMALLAMREHSRRLLHVGLPNGQTPKWRWFDPTLWGALLPKLDASQLDEVFGPLTDWVIVAPSHWQWLTLSAGQLVLSQRECSAE